MENMWSLAWLDGCGSGYMYEEKRSETKTSFLRETKKIGLELLRIYP